MASRIVPEGGWSNLKPFRTPRIKSEGHLAFVRRLPCVCCIHEIGGTRAAEAAHVRAPSARHGKQMTGKGEKPDDRWTIPLCRVHHDEQHSMNELEFWQHFPIDPFLLALVLHGLSGDEHAATEVIRIHARGG